MIEVNLEVYAIALFMLMAVIVFSIIVLVSGSVAEVQSYVA